MGYYRLHSIIVTGFIKQDVLIVHEKAKEIFGELVSDIISSQQNGYESFFIAPDGSKEGWDCSDNYDKLRKDYVDYLKNKDCIYWSEIQYMDEEGENKILRDYRENNEF